MHREVLVWYASIFLWLLATGIGVPPVPEEAGILYAASVNSLHPEVSWPLAWLACGLGILSADCVLYGVGRKWGIRLFTYKWVQRFLSNERRMRIEAKFQAHGMKLLILARFLPPLRTGVFLISGASRYPFVKFVIADMVYCVVGVGMIFFGGSALVALIERVGYIGAWFVAVPLAGYGLYRYFQYLKLRDEQPTPPVSLLQTPAGTAPAGEPVTNLTGTASATHAATMILDAPGPR